MMFHRAQRERERGEPSDMKNTSRSCMHCMARRRSSGQKYIPRPKRWWSPALTNATTTSSSRSPRDRNWHPPPIFCTAPPAAEEKSRIEQCSGRTDEAAMWVRGWWGRAKTTAGSTLSSYSPHKPISPDKKGERGSNYYSLWMGGRYHRSQRPNPIIGIINGEKRESTKTNKQVPLP